MELSKREHKISALDNGFSYETDKQKYSILKQRETLEKLRTQMRLRTNDFYKKHELNKDKIPLHLEKINKSIDDNLELLKTIESLMDISVSQVERLLGDNFILNESKIRARQLEEERFLSGETET